MDIGNRTNIDEILVFVLGKNEGEMNTSKGIDLDRSTYQGYTNNRHTNAYKNHPYRRQISPEGKVNITTLILISHN